MGIYEDQQIHLKASHNQSDFDTAGVAPKLIEWNIIMLLVRSI